MKLNFTAHALSRIKLIFLGLALQCAAYGLTFAQGPETVSGKVTSSEGEALPGVNIVVEGTTTGTVTDLEGNYRLNVPSNATTLLFSSIGYETKKISINGRSVINVELSPDVQALSEVVVIGYGQQSRETLTSSVSKVDSKALENVPMGNAATALQGTVSGVRVRQPSGQPGSEPNIILRGGASINNPEGATPLYVVDGVQRQDLAGINSNNIASMQILKDAAATAIYGARAANGVVIVETKKGVAGEPTLTYNSTFGISQLREKYPVLNARQNIYYQRLGAALRAAAKEGVFSPEGVIEWAQENDFGHERNVGWGTNNDLTKDTYYTTQYLSPENEHKLNEGWESMQDPLFPDRTIIFKGTDWQDVLYRTGFTQDHNLSLSGGSDNATFRIGGGFMDQEGIAIYTGYQRFTGDLDGTVKISDKISASAGLNYGQETDNEVKNLFHTFSRGAMADPTMKYRFEDGTLAPGSSQSIGNPEYHIPKWNNDNFRNTLTLRGGMDFEILPGLNFRPSGSLFVRNIEEHTFQQAFDNGTRGGVNVERQATALYSKRQQKEFAGVFQYQGNFANVHNLDATLGSSYYSRDYSDIRATGRRAATDNIPTLNASAEPVNVSSQMSERRIIGYFTRINYDYNLRYLLTFTARYDGATNLGEENKWGFFPAISTGWNIHNENFWDSPAQINRLKLRASYGTSGNLGNLGDYQAQGQYRVGGAYNGDAAITYNQLENQNLRWEESTTLDLGLDAGLFDNRIFLIFNYYRRVTDNLITTLSLPASTGFTNILTNLGSLENKGVELELGFNVIDTEDFRWNISLNASRNKNKILKLPENRNENNRIGGFFVYDTELGDYTWKGGLQEGGALGDMYAFQQTGVYSTQEEADAGPLNNMRLRAGPENYAGDAAFLDTDGNGEIDLRDRVYMGNQFPDWTGGLSTTLSFKGLNLYIRMDGARGHTIRNYHRIQINGQYAEGFVPTTDMLRSWQKEGDQTDIARFAIHDQIVRGNTWMGDSRRNGGGNSLYYEKGDYLAFREVTLSYSAPASLYEALGFISNLRINITGNNLGYITDYFGHNPESTGGSSNYYPLPRQIILGIKATF